MSRSTGAGVGEKMEKIRIRLPTKVPRKNVCSPEGQRKITLNRIPGFATLLVVIKGGRGGRCKVRGCVRVRVRENQTA